MEHNFVICAFHKLCRRSDCSHKYTHQRSHMKGQCDYPYVCTSYNPRRFRPADEKGSCKTKEDIRAVSLYKFRYSFCVDWRLFEDDSVAVAIGDYDLRNMTGDITTGLYDGQRSKDFIHPKSTVSYIHNWVEDNTEYNPFPISGGRFAGIEEAREPTITTSVGDVMDRSIFESLIQEDTGRYTSAQMDDWHRRVDRAIANSTRGDSDE